MDISNTIFKFLNFFLLESRFCHYWGLSVFFLHNGNDNTHRVSYFCVWQNIRYFVLMGRTQDNETVKQLLPVNLKGELTV